MLKTKAVFAFLFLAILFFSYFGSKIFAQGQPPPKTESPHECIARNLAKYMNTVIDEAGNLNNIRLLSPAFNMTNPHETIIYNYMVNPPNRSFPAANFAGLDGFAGNTYTLEVEGGIVRAVDWLQRNGWLAAAGSFGKPIYLTEFGDFRTADIREGDPSRPGLIASMREDYSQALNAGIAAINYFAVYKDDGVSVNEEFYEPRHRLTRDELLGIISQNPGRAGLNQGLFPQGGRVQSKASELGMGWATEIIGGPDLGIVNSINASPATTIIRLCVGDSCGFSDPTTLVNFLRLLNGQINREVFVIVGPNEPATEYWAATECPVIDSSRPGGGIPGVPPAGSLPPIGPRPPVPFTPCSQTQNQEFHSLRPYPASPCNQTPLTETRMCANDLTVREVFQATPAQAVNCRQNSPTTQICSFRVSSNIDLEIYTGDTRLPVVGNTELVPNSQTEENKLDNPTRMNEYVSWFLNGITSRAEEEDELIRKSPPYLPIQTSSLNEIRNRLHEIINFSGPIKKLLPFAVQNGKYLTASSGSMFIPNKVLIPDPNQPGLRGEQKNLATKSRHNQIAVCEVFKIINLPLPTRCYRGNDSSRLRIRDLNPIMTVSGILTQTIDTYNPIFSFIPFSSTEDLYGEAAVDLDTNKIEVRGSVTIENFTPNIPQASRLSFPHMQETYELANILQKTFAPAHKIEDPTGRGFGVVEYGNPPMDQLNEQRNMNFCEIKRTFKNPGDLVYGGWEVQNNAHTYNRANGSLSYNASFECEFPLPIPDPTCMNLCISGINDGSLVLPPGTTPNQYCSEVLCKPQEPACTQYTEFAMKIKTITPLADFLWDRLVAGESAVFRRIFPRVEEGAPVDKILDIPAEDKIWYYSGSQNFTGGTLLGNGPLAGNPLNMKPGRNASIYFPHLGSVHEYFLKQIQTALRPYGFGGQSQTGPSVPTVPTTEAKQHLFENTCEGQVCYEYIISQTTANPLCQGRYFNPYIAIAIALNENGGLVSNLPDGSNIKHFGCDPFGRLGIGLTPIEKFRCMINTFSNSCNNGLSEEEALERYGYNPSDNLNNLVNILGLNQNIRPRGYNFDLWIDAQTAQSYAQRLRNILPTQRDLWYRYYKPYIDAYR